MNPAADYSLTASVPLQECWGVGGVVTTSCELERTRCDLCCQFDPLVTPPTQTTDPPTAVVLMQVWFQNRRSKERRMKQLSALGARRHAFFRGPRRMRPLGGRLEDPDILGPGAYGYYGGTTLLFCLFLMLTIEIDPIEFSH